MDGRRAAAAASCDLYFGFLSPRVSRGARPKVRTHTEREEGGLKEEVRDLHLFLQLGGACGLPHVMAPSPFRSALVAVGAAAAVTTCYLLSRRKRRPAKVVITGGCGNLGIKLATHLLGDPAIECSVTLIEHPDYHLPARVPAGASVVLADLRDAGDAGWRAALQGADTVVHFSAVNPYPNASWEESAGSMSHTFNLFIAAVASGVRRVVFASSNHVMGGYKDLPTHAVVTPECPARCGTLLRDPLDRAKSGDATAYAAAKLAGEQAARALAATSGSATTFVALRIGWCQPGANLPSTLNPSGSPPQFQNDVVGEGGGSTAADNDAKVDEDWFKNMWLSNGDFLRYFSAALSAPVPAGRLLVLNAMSRNTGMRWSIEATERALGVVARDNSRA